LAAAFGMRVLAVDARRRDLPPGVAALHGPETLDSLLPEADFVILTVPHTPATEGFMNRARFQRMKRTAFFINIGRGMTTRLDDLVAALRAGEIAGPRPPPARPPGGPARGYLTPHPAAVFRSLPPPPPLRVPPQQLPALRPRPAAAERGRQASLVLSPPMPVPVGLNVWSRLVEDMFPYLDRTVAPFKSLWFPDHVQYGANKVAEGWTLLAFALARYPDKLGTHEVLCNSFRNPAHLAKMVATAQALSGGRVILGIGAGWNEEEYRAYGWPFPPTPVRIAQMCEAIELIRLMWTSSPATYKGEHYQITGAHCEPRPNPIPPVVVGGHGEKYLLRAVAKHAD